MPNTYLPINPVRAERYQPGMTEILGLPIVTIHGKTTFAPHSLHCELKGGDWAVEAGDRIINLSGNKVRDGRTIRVLSDAEFREGYGLVSSTTTGSVLVSRPREMVTPTVDSLVP